MTKVFTIPVTLEGANRKKDRSISMRFNSLFEVNNDDFAHLDTMYQSMGYLMFSESEINQEDIPDEDIETDIAKSQSTQIRDALWVLFKAKGNNAADKDAWNIYYRQQMQSFKARILEEVHKIEEQ